MMVKKVHRLIALTLMLALGLAVVAEGASAAGMQAAMAMAPAADAPMPDGCDRTATPACAAACAGLVALPSTFSNAIELTWTIAVSPASGSRLFGTVRPPDPPPPRPI